MRRKKKKEIGSKNTRKVKDHETGSLMLRTPGLFGSTSVSILCLYFVSELFKLTRANKQRTVPLHRSARVSAQESHPSNGTHGHK